MAAVKNLETCCYNILNIDLQSSQENAGLIVDLKAKITSSLNNQKEFCKINSSQKDFKSFDQDTSNLSASVIKYCQTAERVLSLKASKESEKSVGTTKESINIQVLLEETVQSIQTLLATLRNPQATETQVVGNITKVNENLELLFKDTDNNKYSNLAVLDKLQKSGKNLLAFSEKLSTKAETVKTLKKDIAATSFEVAKVFIHLL